MILFALYKMLSGWNLQSVYRSLNMYQFAKLSLDYIYHLFLNWALVSGNIWLRFVKEFVVQRWVSDATDVLHLLFSTFDTYRELHSYVSHNICSKIGGVQNTMGTKRNHVKLAFSSQYLCVLYSTDQDDYTFMRKIRCNTNAWCKNFNFFTFTKYLLYRCKNS